MNQLLFKAPRPSAFFHFSLLFDSKNSKTKAKIAFTPSKIPLLLLGLLSLHTNPVILTLQESWCLYGIITSLYMSV